MSSGKPVDKIVARFLKEKLDLIRREYSPTRLIVFGSRAEGRGREDSDIDILVVSERFRDIRFPNRMGQFLNTVWPDVPVDAICYTPEEFEIMLHGQSSFVRNAIEHGIEIQ
jgi:uncharacterized protein